MSAPVARTGWGVVAGITGYALWGLYPLYWPLLEPAGAVEILAHRIVWSAVLVLAVLLALGRARALFLRAGAQRTVLLSGSAAVLMALNWGIYIWAVNDGRVVDTALGYFINPLMTIAAGVLLLHERLHLAQRVAITLACTSALVLVIGQRTVPWVALALAGSFAGYTILKKRVGLPAVDGFAVETSLLAVPALGVVAWLELTGHGTLGADGARHAALLVLAGGVSAAPLLCFGAAVTRLPLATLGAIQYLAPVLQFLVGVFIEHEAMPAARWLGFVLVWAAILVLVIDTMYGRSRASRSGPVVVTLPESASAPLAGPPLPDARTGDGAP